MNIMSALLHFGKLTTSGSLVKQPRTFQVSYVFPAAALVPLVLSRFLAEHVTGKARFLILVVPCWMEASWLSRVL